jgi:renalase
MATSDKGGPVTRRVAVVGAGIAGLACARELRLAGLYVDVYERERIIGGRLGTTRLGITAFDYGAQYLTARGARFRKFLDDLSAQSYAARWNPHVAGAEGGGQMLPWYVGTPGMSSVVRPLAESVRITTSRTVHTLARDEDGWRIWFTDETSVGPFAAVAIAVPAPEAQLLAGRIPGFAERIATARMQPCWALLVKLDERILPKQDVYSDMSEVVRWVARNNTKPGRSGKGDHIVVHASPKWSREAEDAEPEVITQELWGEVSNLLSLPPVRPSQMSAILWRHGLVDTALGESFIFSSEHGVGTCGDWCLGRLAEHAFESGLGLGRAIVNAIT